MCSSSEVYLYITNDICSTYIYVDIIENKFSQSWAYSYAYKIIHACRVIYMFGHIYNKHIGLYIKLCLLAFINFSTRFITSETERKVDFNKDITL